MELLLIILFPVFVIIELLHHKEEAFMQEFRDLGPYLINVTMSDDRMPVYALRFGIRFSDLTDDEKESAYFSQRYLAEKYEKEVY